MAINPQVTLSCRQQNDQVLCLLRQSHGPRVINPLPQLLNRGRPLDVCPSPGKVVHPVPLQNDMRGLYVHIRQLQRNRKLTNQQSL